MEWSMPATPACSYRLGQVGGSSAYPVVSAPSASSHRDSQLPLKPVCPVRNTRRPFQNERLTMIDDRAAMRRIRYDKKGRPQRSRLNLIEPLELLADVAAPARRMARLQ